MLEVGGDAAIYFNPNDSNNIEEKVKLLIENKNIKDLKIKKIYERNQQFSWEKCASKTQKFYESILE